MYSSSVSLEAALSRTVVNKGQADPKLRVTLTATPFLAAHRALLSRLLWRVFQRLQRRTPDNLYRTRQCSTRRQANLGTRDDGAPEILVKRCRN